MPLLALTSDVWPSRAEIVAEFEPTEHLPAPSRPQSGANLTNVQLTQLLARLSDRGEPVSGGVVLSVGNPYQAGQVAAFGVAPDGRLVWMLEEWRAGGPDRFQVTRWRFSLHPARVEGNHVLPMDAEREEALHRGNIVEAIRGPERVPLTPQAILKFQQTWEILIGVHVTSRCFNQTQQEGRQRGCQDERR